MAHSFLIILGMVFIALFIGACIWQRPGLVAGKLTDAEIEHFMEGIQKLSFPEDVDTVDLFKRIRTWAKADDKKPFYMLNMIRYYPENKVIEGYPPKGTPKQTNAHYEKLVVGKLFKLGCLGGSFVGDTHGSNLLPIGSDPALDHWNRVQVVRYPSRRHFMRLMSDPKFKEIEPYKMMSMELMLSPMKGQLVMPDYRIMIGLGLTIMYLLIALMIQ